MEILQHFSLLRDTLFCMALAKQLGDGYVFSQCSVRYALSVCLSVCLNLSLCMSVFCLSLCLPGLYLSLCQSVSISPPPPHHSLSVCLSLSLSVCVCLSVCLSLCLSSLGSRSQPVPFRKQLGVKVSTNQATVVDLKTQ